jgi:succinate dehydrogenase / fumarate reductase membrane anchor subunit
VVKAYLSGARAWLLQRATALYLLGFVVWFGVRNALAPPASYEAWRAWMLSTGPRLATLLFFVALALHAWVGLRDIVIDYVKPFALRLAALAAVAGGLGATLAWALLVIAGQP